MARTNAIEQAGIGQSGAVVRNIEHDETSLLHSRDAAKLLTISERTLWDISSPRGTVPTVRMGRSVRYLRGDLLAWLRQQSH
jgi:predicted DNA-binding transcriptional regulator AlpA